MQLTIATIAALVAPPLVSSAPLAQPDPQLIKTGDILSAIPWDAISGATVGNAEHLAGIATGVGVLGDEVISTVEDLANEASDVVDEGILSPVQGLIGLGKREADAGVLVVKVEKAEAGARC
ncbi:hypothetical protein V8F20_001482 [Naviculisporaceae sp. PSN 640]